MADCTVDGDNRLHVKLEDMAGCTLNADQILATDTSGTEWRGVAIEDAVDGKLEQLKQEMRKEMERNFHKYMNRKPTNYIDHLRKEVYSWLYPITTEQQEPHLDPDLQLRAERQQAAQLARTSLEI